MLTLGVNKKMTEWHSLLDSIEFLGAETGITVEGAKDICETYTGLVMCRIDKNNKQWVVQCEDEYVKGILATYATT
jgi:hypothetical protein